MAKKRTSVKRRAKAGSMKKVTAILAGASLAALYEVFVSPMIPLARNIKNILEILIGVVLMTCLLYTSPSPRDGLLSRMPSSA